MSRIEGREFIGVVLTRRWWRTQPELPPPRPRASLLGLLAPPVLMFSISSVPPSLLLLLLLPRIPPCLSPLWTLPLPCPTPAGLSEQGPLHLHFSGHCLANGLLICSIVPCEANSISASQSSLPVDSVIDWRNSCHRPAACSLLPSPSPTTPPPPWAAALRPQKQCAPATCLRICRQQ